MSNYTQWLKNQRELIEYNPNLYTDQKEVLYQELALIVKRLNDKDIQNQSEKEFHNIPLPSESASLLKKDLEEDLVKNGKNL